ncbi:MAG: hypothetical protein ACREAK_08145 [Nitrosarchaeum sp.]
MCSGCNKSYKEFVNDDRFKYLDLEQIQLMVLRDILKALHTKQEGSKA